MDGNYFDPFVLVWIYIGVLFIYSGNMFIDRGSLQSILSDESFKHLQNGHNLINLSCLLKTIAIMSIMQWMYCVWNSQDSIPSYLMGLLSLMCSLGLRNIVHEHENYKSQPVRCLLALFCEVCDWGSQQKGTRNRVYNVF